MFKDPVARRKFLLEFARENEFDPLVPKNWDVVSPWKTQNKVSISHPHPPHSVPSSASSPPILSLPTPTLSPSILTTPHIISLGIRCSDAVS